MFLAIDIGGTTTRVGISRNLREIERVELFNSQKTLTLQRDYIKSAINKLVTTSEITAIALGVAGIVDTDRCLVKKSPNYAQLDNLTLRTLIPPELEKIPLLCCNDTQLAALGESVYGAGSGKKRVGYLSLGTGVGGALIINSKLEEVPNIYEPGHHVIDINSKTADGLGIVGSLETYISGTAFAKRYSIAPDVCNDPKIWFEFGKIVGIGITNLQFMWDPDCIIIGGGVSEQFEQFLPGIHAYIDPIIFPRNINVLKAHFGQGSGVVGGLALLSQQIKS